ncbi:MAG: hypothetical protein ACRDTS_05470, partial [Mycobacterium sp.]
MTASAAATTGFETTMVRVGPAVRLDPVRRVALVRVALGRRAVRVAQVARLARLVRRWVLAPRSLRGVLVRRWVLAPRSLRGVLVRRWVLVR